MLPIKENPPPPRLVPLGLQCDDDARDEKVPLFDYPEQPIIKTETGSRKLSEPAAA